MSQHCGPRLLGQVVSSQALKVFKPRPENPQSSVMVNRGGGIPVLGVWMNSDVFNDPSINNSIVAYEN